VFYQVEHSWYYRSICSSLLAVVLLRISHRSSARACILHACMRRWALGPAAAAASCAVQFRALLALCTVHGALSCSALPVCYADAALRGDRGILSLSLHVQQLVV
jgi:hypothetical protein